MKFGRSRNTRIATGVATGQHGVGWCQEGSAPAQRAYFGPEIKTVWNGADLDGWAFWGLLNRYTVISRIVGSNPIPSANSCYIISGYQ
jgi:hypothetical protein